MYHFMGARFVYVLIRIEFQVGTRCAPKPKVRVKYDGKFVISFNFMGHMNPLSEVVAFALVAHPTHRPSQLLAL